MDSFKTIEQQLKTILNNQAASKEVLTFDETAIFTGFSKSYLYKLTSAGIVPHSNAYAQHIMHYKDNKKAPTIKKGLLK